MSQARSKRKTADGSTDRLSAVPEGLLLDILSFLPSRNAVRTCVLASRWRNLWKEVPALRITPATTSRYSDASALNKFVNYLLFFRNRSPLHVTELSSYEGGDFDEAVQYLEVWIRHRYEIGGCGDKSCWRCQLHKKSYGNNNCILLHGLSSCTNLELTAATAPFIFRKDLTRCPVFRKLKTLLINEWCITNNLRALICFLQHSPVLEKLIIQFDPPEIHERLVEIGASYDLRKQPLVLKDLIVEVICDDGDERIGKVLDVLGSYGLPPEKIKIQQPQKLTRARFDDTWTSRNFSFQQI